MNHRATRLAAGLCHLLPPCVVRPSMTNWTAFLVSSAPRPNSKKKKQFERRTIPNIQSHTYRLRLINEKPIDVRCLDETN